LIAALGSAHAQQVPSTANALPDLDNPPPPAAGAEATTPAAGNATTPAASDATASAPAPADAAAPAPAAPPAPTEGQDNSRLKWLDQTHQTVYNTVWHSAMRVDRWFGSDRAEGDYQRGASGSIAPAVLWDQYRGVQTMLRFNLNFPLPQLDERFHAFIGRVNPEEFVTERDEPSGAFERQVGPVSQDETLFGLAFYQPRKQGGYFDAGAGVRIALPFDPYIKGSYNYELGSSERGLFTYRQTLFWQNSDGVGTTTRFDLERIYNLRWLVRFAVSGTFSQRSYGVRGYGSLLAMRGFADRRALAIEFSIDGQTLAEVPLHDYGVKVAWRQAVLRRWLIMEIRTGVDWPQDYRFQNRSANFGVGLGFEMMFGTDQFLARPVTF
jgi:hypothetical protein